MTDTRCVNKGEIRYGKVLGEFKVSRRYRKKHKITEEEIEFLKQLQKEMNTQDNVGQADPRYWVIRDWERIYGEELNNPDGCEILLDGEEIIHANYGVFGVDDLIIQKAKEYFVNESDQFEEEDFELFGTDELKEMLEEHGYYISIIEYELIPQYSGFFLTQKAAEEHLRANYYHYDDNATTYAMTAWRSKEADMLYKILREVDFGEMYNGEE